MITQALVAIGGRATRLVSAGYDVPVSKAFLQFGGQPLLRWSLSSLYLAGVKSVVLAGNESLQLAEARLLVESLPFTFSRVDYFEDPGLGVHGLPFHARHLLDDRCIFECGHSLMEPKHYQKLASRKGSRNIVMSAFVPHPSNLRQPVSVAAGGRIIEVGALSGPELKSAVAHPIAIDQQYISKLPDLAFNISEILEHHVAARSLSSVSSRMPPEFDVAAELLATLELEAAYLDTMHRTGGLLTF